MKVIRVDILEAFWLRHERARKATQTWLRNVQAADWKNFQQVRETFARHADPYRGSSGDDYVIFNVGGNKYRVVAQVSYSLGVVAVVLAMTHEEYSRSNWEQNL